MDAIMAANDWLNGIVWGPPMLILIVGTGVFVTLLTGVFQVTKIKVWWKATFGKIFSKEAREKDASNISPFQAVTTALASTVGTGNIAGVATAIYLGGPGAVFWMWVSAFFGMMTKYAEIVLAVKFRETDEKGAYHGGPMYYIQNGLKMKWLAVIFAIFGTLATFGIGNMTQANAIAGALNRSFGVPEIATGIAIAILVALVIIGGIKRIGAVTEKVVPFMCIFYVILGVVVLIINARFIPGAFGAIFAGAFNTTAVGSGVMGYVIMRAIRYGIARGVFSNEAGLGSAPIAHAATSEKDPVKQGLWGVFEVFVDTMIICTFTALIVLTAGLYQGDVSGITLVMNSAASSVGEIGSIFISIAVTFFAGSTILGWSYYGMQCLGYLTNKNKTVGLVYKVIFCGVAIVGAVGGLTFVWDLADTLNGLMAIPNLIAIVLLSKVVIQLTKEYLSKEAK
ncbi:MAG: sodium:alanine symporter family protein [Treponema sp.]|nr:sodium:alanine symporter family protein [Treponema sp.]